MESEGRDWETNILVAAGICLVNLFFGDIVTKILLFSSHTYVSPKIWLDQKKNIKGIIMTFPDCCDTLIIANTVQLQRSENGSLCLVAVIVRKHI